MELLPTPGMMDVMAKIMVEVLSILGAVTKEIKQGTSEGFPTNLAPLAESPPHFVETFSAAHYNTRHPSSALCGRLQRSRSTSPQ